jgi:hypothetical protein
VESVPITIPAQATTTLAISHLNPGESVRRASFIDQTTTTAPTSISFSLLQWRYGAQVGSALGTLSFGSGGITNALAPNEFAMAQTTGAFQPFEEHDVLVLSVTQGGTPQQIVGLLSWW